MPPELEKIRAQNARRSAELMRVMVRAWRVPEIERVRAKNAREYGQLIREASRRWQRTLG